MSANILYVCSNVDPYTPDGLIAKMCRTIPQQVQEQGMQVRMFMPLYGLINERRGQLHEVIRLSGMNLILAQSDHQLIIKVASIAGARLQVYFIDNEEYFSRKAFFADPNSGEFFEDNDLRSMFFSRGTIETVKKLRWAPNIVHINGWMSALTALYLKKTGKVDPIFSGAKVVVSLYADNFEGSFDVSMGGKLKKEGIKGVAEEFVNEPTYHNLMREAIACSSGVVVCQEGVDQTLVDYARELGLPVMDNIQSEPQKSAEIQLPKDLGVKYKEFYQGVLGQ